MTYGTYLGGTGIGGTSPGPLCAGSRLRAAGWFRRPGAPSPTIEAIEAIIDAAFWASLRREEGYVPEDFAGAAVRRTRRRIRCCSSGRCRSSPAALAQAWRRRSSAPASISASWPRRRRRLGVGHDAHASAVLPRARSRRAGPARRQASPRRRPAKFVQRRGARGRPDQDRRRERVEPARLPAAPDVAARLRLAGVVGAIRSTCSCSSPVSMRAHGRGGLLLVVPAGNDRVARLDRPADSVRASTAVFAARRADASERSTNRQDQRLWQDALSRAVEAIAGPDRRRRRDAPHRQLRPARVRREDRPPARDRRRSSR